MTNINGDLERILWYASLAPSTHNCQPWAVDLLPGKNLELVIQSDSSRWLPRTDPGNRELMLSIGAFWENLEQAANALGFEVHTEIVAAQTTDTDILKVKLVENREITSPSSESLKSMENRYTNRLKYKQQDISPSHLEECLALSPGILAYFPRESQKGKWLAHSQIEAMRQQVFNDGKQKEMAEWTRFSRSLAAQRGDGTTAEMAGISGIGKFFWYTFMNPKSLLSKNARIGIVQIMKKRVTWCAGFFALYSEDDSVPSLLHAGRALERLFLKGTQLNIQATPLTQLVHEAPWNRQLGDQLGLEKPIQMIVCAGYPLKHHQTGTRLRRPVKDFVIHREVK